MGNKVSSVNGVRSPNFYKPGNAVNEVWVGDLEVISRLPFGDSDMAQAGWPKHDWPKFPWRPFVIPLRALVQNAAKSKSARSLASSLSKRAEELPDPAFPHLATVKQAMDIAATITSVIICLLAYIPDHILLCTNRKSISPSISVTDVEGGKHAPARNRSAAFLRAILGSMLFVLTLVLFNSDSFYDVRAYRLDETPPPECADEHALVGRKYVEYRIMAIINCFITAAFVTYFWHQFYKAQRRDLAFDSFEHRCNPSEQGTALLDESITTFGRDYGNVAEFHTEVQEKLTGKPRGKSKAKRDSRISKMIRLSTATSFRRRKRHRRTKG
ncbi:hypothetical protein AJ80_03765 [Polytolypa hystricis UAMH7299]|uniref:Uncharacterized protein n=1 Tax=Polytolypa hystricis (strain UAMH7299) TaxID=1447883 RepID=A0A2B7YG08_POLH7|nr:hypothetical protein AJ80_03765 [Polytolypa hystricis UAMH7299]